MKYLKEFEKFRIFGSDKRDKITGSLEDNKNRIFKFGNKKCEIVLRRVVSDWLKRNKLNIEQQEIENFLTRYEEYYTSIINDEVKI
jgi:hypothetical protein